MHTQALNRHPRTTRSNSDRRPAQPQSNRRRIAPANPDGPNCHWPGCQHAVNAKQWACDPHWNQLPPQLREDIRKTYRPGQEKDKNPSEAYILVAQEVQFWIVNNGAIYA